MPSHALRKRDAVKPGHLLVALLLAGCGAAETDSAPGVRFDPTSLLPGDRVGDLIADSLSIRQTSGSDWVGMAHFRGELMLGGHASHPPEAATSAVCFEADSISAARMPRWAGDRRRPVVCFTNPAQAARELGPAVEARPATIVIDGFSVQRGQFDGLNRARFVRLLARDG